MKIIIRDRPMLDDLYPIIGSHVVTKKGNELEITFDDKILTEKLEQARQLLVQKFPNKDVVVVSDGKN